MWMHHINADVRCLNLKTVLFQVIQFCLSNQFSSLWHIDKTLSGTTTPGNEGILPLLQSSSIAGYSPSHCLGSYPVLSFFVGVLSLCREAFSVFYNPSRQGKCREKARRELQKNTMSYIEQILKHSTKQQLYGHIPPISKPTQISRTRHAEHCWRSKDELISDVHS